MDSNYEFCLIGSHSNVGKVRKANEDSTAVFDTPNGKIITVCDGMGGHIGGQVASQTAIAAIRDFLLNNIFPDPKEAIHHTIIAANDAILRRVQSQPELAGMGSTCVMLLITPDGKVYYGHVGDSRIYIIANRQIKQLTKDHSFVQMLVDTGQITKEQAEHHPQKNEITNALGIANMQAPTVCNEAIEPGAGNCFLLCSDGLTGMVDDMHIQRVVSNRSLGIQQRAEKLVQSANDAGGVDNITVQLVEFALGAQDIFCAGQKKKFNIKRLLLYLLPLAVILGTLIYLLTPKFLKSDTAKIKITEDKHNHATESLIAKGDTTFTLSEIALTETEQDVVLKGEYLPENDSLISIDVVQQYKGFVGITKTKTGIRIKQLKKDMKSNQITLMCETKRYKTCGIIIPLKTQGEQKSESVPSVRNIILDSVEFKQNVQITVKLTVERQKLIRTGKKTSNDPSIKVDVINTELKKSIVIEFTKDKEIESVTFIEGPYKFIIPVKKMKNGKQNPKVPKKDTNPTTLSI